VVSINGTYSAKWIECNDSKTLIVSAGSLQYAVRQRFEACRRSIQGFGLSAPERAALESYSMRRAKEYFAARCYSVRDVSRTCSFDLLCCSADTELRVEVKGTTSLGEQIVLTKREVEEASMPGYVLFVVSEILLASEGGSVVAGGGQCRVIPLWRQEKHILKPIAYSVTLDWSEGESIETGDRRDF
jgi:Protein NO VEIN, C-terminal